MSEHGSFDKDFLLPSREIADEGAERGVCEEFAVGGGCVDLVEEVVDVRFRGASDSSG